MEPAPETRAPAKSEELAPQPATIEEAQAQLDRARAELEGARRGEGPAVHGSTGTGAVTTPPVAPEPTTTTASPDAAEREPAACTTPCRAIASMRRAVEAICRMAGEQDARCSGARKTLGESEVRVAGCRC
jgi:hypothetical protein